MRNSARLKRQIRSSVSLGGVPCPTNTAPTTKAFMSVKNARKHEARAAAVHASALHAAHLLISCKMALPKSPVAMLLVFRRNPMATQLLAENAPRLRRCRARFAQRQQTDGSSWRMLLGGTSDAALRSRVRGRVTVCFMRSLAIHNLDAV